MPVTTQKTDSRQRVLDAAATLFADSGFDGVSTRQIAAATDLNISTVHHHVGSKRQLYAQVIENLYRQEEELVATVLDRVDEEPAQDSQKICAALVELIDRLLQFALQNPERQKLYIQRWLEPKDELSSREANLTLKLYRRLSRYLKRAQQHGSVRHDLDIGYFLRSFDWLIFNYFVSGAFSWRTLRADPLKRDNLNRFRTYLMDYLKRMLEP